jgi:hypothetical protein
VALGLNAAISRTSSTWLGSKGENHEKSHRFIDDVHWLSHFMPISKGFPSDSNCYSSYKNRGIIRRPSADIGADV